MTLKKPDRPVASGSLLRVAMIVTLGLTLFCPPGARGKPVAREVIAFYDSAEGRNESNCEIRQMAEMPLNYLGMIVRYRDINAGLPREEELRGVRGFITWFQDGRMREAEEYCRWVSEQAGKGRNFIILGNFGAYRDSRTGSLVRPRHLNRAFRALGVEYMGEATNNPALIRIVKKRPDLVEFERKLAGGAKSYVGLKVTNRRVKTWLTVARGDKRDSESPAVFVGPGGGMALPGYVAYFHPDGKKRAWYLNPFAFFTKALGLAEVPVPDVTTLSGKRILYTHIDGDAFTSKSRVVARTLCSEVVRDSILLAYPIPISVAFVTAWLDKGARGTDRYLAIAESMAKIPWVELGSHTFSHPHDWRTGKTDIQVDGYSFDLEKEIVGSIEVINSLVPGKRVKLMQWSGSCNPTARALQLVDSIGIGNINGGDPVFDPEFPTYGRLAPYGRLAGAELQVYTSNANENIYTNLWTEPLFGFRNVRYAFLATESPRRVSAMNIYYHFYAAEVPASLAATRSVYESVLGFNAAPVFASDYAAIVRGFYGARIERESAREWVISENGRLRTLRLRDRGLGVDFDKSKGITGLTRYEGNVYIYLDASDEHRLVLTDRRPHLPYIVEAPGFVDSVSFRTDSAPQPVTDPAGPAGMGDSLQAVPAPGGVRAGRPTFAWMEVKLEAYLAPRSSTEELIRVLERPNRREGSPDLVGRKPLFPYSSFLIFVCEPDIDLAVRVESDLGVTDLRARSDSKGIVRFSVPFWGFGTVRIERVEER